MSWKGALFYRNTIRKPNSLLRSLGKYNKNGCSDIQLHLHENGQSGHPTLSSIAMVDDAFCKIL